MLKPGLYYTAMRKWINTYFNFTKAEFNGMLSLFVLIILFAVLPRLYFWLQPAQPDPAEVEEIRSLKLEQHFRAKPKKPRFGIRDQHKTKAKRYTFDPNTLNQQGWEDFGLTPKQAKAIINYRSKGGKFRKAEDLKKMYTIRPELYEMLKPHVQISDTIQRPVYQNYSKATFTKKPLSIYELNALDTTEMQAINGIGPAFARRIFKYRERLGGFAQPEQLLEVFGIDSVHYEQIRPQIRIDEGLLRKININTADFETLRQHPYLRYKQVNAIIEYRKQHGNYSSFADLKKVAILPAETVDKLVPYFSF
jgi:competence protein ComEA